jgi:hypothetical protein
MAKTSTNRSPEYENDPASVGGWTNDLDSKYQPSDFVLPGSDHQGHSERVYCRVQPQVARAMSKILGSKKFPFRTMGDLQRWCIARGLKVLDRLEPMPGFMGMADAINEVLKQELYMQEFTQMFNTMGQVIQSHINAGATGEARRLLSIVLGHISKIEEHYWKKKAEDEVKNRFAHLLEGGGRTVSLRVVGQANDNDQEDE